MFCFVCFGIFMAFIVVIQYVNVEETAERKKVRETERESDKRE